MNSPSTQDSFDYSFVDATARVALYDDLKSAPRITEVHPAGTNDFIEKLTTTVYEQSKLAGGKVPYTLIREVSENFIHAQFREIVVSILDDGNTIRFADQGPGIREKEKAQEPGFTSATEPMKRYIRGVGSGFPLVRDYLDNSDGSIVIEDNLVSGAVVTISLEQPSCRTSKQGGATAPQRTAASGVGAINDDSSFTAYSRQDEGQRPSPQDLARILPRTSAAPLTPREQDFLTTLMREGELGVTELSELTATPVSTTYNTLKRLEQSALVEKSTGKKRWLTDLGYQIAKEL